jgi:hypothetical protein
MSAVSTGSTSGAGEPNPVRVQEFSVQNADFVL